MSPPAADVLSVLWGARVRRVDVPEADLVALTLLVGRETTTLIVSVAEAAAGIGLVDERPRGAPAGSFAQLLRKHLEGAELARASSVGALELELTFAREGEQASLHLSLRRRAAGVVLIDGAGRRLAGIPRGTASISEEPHGAPDPDAWPRDLDELRVAGAALMKRRSGEGERGRDTALRRSLVRSRERVQRRARAIEGDLAAAAVAPQLRADGALLLSALHAIAARATEARLADPETGAERTVPLDPALGASENAERLFVRARKLDRGARIASARLRDAQDELARIDAALAALSAGDAAPAAALSAPASAPRAAAPAPKRVPYRVYVLEDGATIWVGRGARENDALTFRHAAPDDVFFHARGRTGAHVILRAVAGRAPSDEDRIAAGRLAAHFSAARSDTAVEVLVAQRRHLRRGKAPGSVIARESATLRVRMDDAALAALLAREQTS